MRIAYLDCFAGIAGDMFLGALIEAGVPLAVLQDATSALLLNASLRVETVDRSGISCTKVHVMEGGRLADAPPLYAHTHAAEPTSMTTSHVAISHNGTHTVQPQMQHQHKTGHAHTHDPSQGQEAGHDEVPLHSHEPVHEDSHEHPHTHGRSLTVIRELIQSAELDAEVKHLAIRAFELLGHSEAKIHNVPVEEIHFHEVGAVDAIVDMVAASAGIHHLKIGAWHSSPVNVGGGMVQCAHGTFPVPAPATADLLRDCPTYSAHVQKELVTPTGAALLRTLSPSFGPQPAMRVEQIGYGAGTRNPKDFPNVLRLSIGEAADASTANQEDAAAPSSSMVMPSTTAPRSITGTLHTTGTRHSNATQTVTVMETALDDLSPQIIAYVTEQALAQGALDVMLTPVIMKKGRPGTLLTLLCDPEKSEALQQLLLRETSTLGLRTRQEQRTCLERSHLTVDTAYGSIRVKLGTQGGEVRNVAPEFEDCRAAATEHQVPLKQVQQAAIAAYLDTGSAVEPGTGPGSR